MSRVFGGETLLEDARTGEVRMLVDWLRDEGGLSVWAHSERRPEEAAVEAVRGLGLLYRLVFSDRTEMVVTREHRLRGPRKGWVSISELLHWAQLCRPEDYHAMGPLTLKDDVHLVSYEEVRHGETFRVSVPGAGCFRLRAKNRVLNRL
jgi:hypothetical protein